MVASLLRYRRFEVVAHPNSDKERDDLWQFIIYGEENVMLLMSEMFPSAIIALAECTALIQGIESAKTFWKPSDRPGESFNAPRGILWE